MPMTAEDVERSIREAFSRVSRPEKLAEKSDADVEEPRQDLKAKPWGRAHRARVDAPSVYDLVVEFPGLPLLPAGLFARVPGPNA